jgi:hypothetical protein
MERKGGRKDGRDVGRKGGDEVSLHREAVVLTPWVPLSHRRASAKEAE